MGKTSGKAIASLIFGILSLILGWIPIIGWMFIIVAIVLGFLALRDIKKHKSVEGKGLAIAGIIMGFIPLVIGIFLMALGFFAYFGALDPSSLLPEERQEVQGLDTTVTEEIEVPAEPEQKEYSEGDYIQAGDFKWRITDVSTASQIGEDIYGTFMGVKADGIFLILDVEVENTGKSAKYLMDSYLKLIDDQGREFSPDSTAAFYLESGGSASMMFDTINPGIVKKGKIVYDVPKDINVVTVRISSDLFEESFYSVKLMV